MKYSPFSSIYLPVQMKPYKLWHPLLIREKYVENI